MWADVESLTWIQHLPVNDRTATVSSKQSMRLQCPVPLVSGCLVSQQRYTTLWHVVNWEGTMSAVASSGHSPEFLTCGPRYEFCTAAANARLDSALCPADTPQTKTAPCYAGIPQSTSHPGLPGACHHAKTSAQSGSPNSWSHTEADSAATQISQQARTAMLRHRRVSMMCRLGCSCTFQCFCTCQFKCMLDP